MKTDLDHLPEPQQGELRRIVAILTAELEKAVAGGTQPFRKTAQILKIILFGSYARGDWVDEPRNGYQSDFDLLVIVSHEKLTEIADYWYVEEDKILRDEAIPRTVNLIVHTLQEVNSALASGQYFSPTSRATASPFTSCQDIRLRRRSRPPPRRRMRRRRGILTFSCVRWANG